MNTKRSMSSQVKNNIDFIRPSYNIQVYKNNYLDDNNLILSPSKDNMTTSPSLLTSTELFVAKPKQSELRAQIENELNPMLFSFKNEIKIMISDFKKELGDYALLKEKIEVIEKHYEQSQTKFSEKIDKLLYENTKEFNDYKEENKQKINNVYEILDSKISQNNDNIIETVKTHKSDISKEVTTIYNNCMKIDNQIKNHIDKTNTNFTELSNKLSQFQNDNISMINNFKSEIDSIPKSNDILITEKINVLSQDLMKNYITSSLFELTKKKLEQQLKNINDRIPLIEEHLSSLESKVSSFDEKFEPFNERISSIDDKLSLLPYTPKEDFAELKQAFETIQKSITETKLRSSNAFNGSSSNHSVNSSLLTEVQSRLDINDELLSEHQKILSRYNTKFLEKKDIKQYITDNLFSSNLLDQILSQKQSDMNIRITQVETKVNDILTNKIPNLTSTIYLRQNK